MPMVAPVVVVEVDANEVDEPTPYLGNVDPAAVCGEFSKGLLAAVR